MRRFLRLYLWVLLSLLGCTLVVAIETGLRYGFAVFLDPGVREGYALYTPFLLVVALAVAVSVTIARSNRASQIAENVSRRFVFGWWLIVGLLGFIIAVAIAAIHVIANGVAVTDPHLVRGAAEIAGLFALAAMIGAFGLFRARR